ncbi:MAG: dTDP-4-dehydrorhamnose reductase [Lentisphaeraceae bacterium]|nr:dTDP-4-dehydrorhamnose reductase [Lentisphaeraceae bacterium]
MKVLVIGLGGQLAYELQKTIPASVEATFLTIDDLDITVEQDVLKTVSTSGAAVVINAAAYTAVDRAEDDKELAYAVNASGAKYLAAACKAIDGRLIHISTDFVFEGASSTPYNTSDIPLPQSVYGTSKLAGEQAVIEVMAEKSVIIRTAWLYSAFANNFVKTMLKLMKTKDSLGIIADQVGTPTWAYGLAQAVWAATLDEKISGLYHWSDAGVASWYDFSIAIQELGLELEMLDTEIPIKPIGTKDYPTPAQRPQYSVLDKEDIHAELNLTARHWRRQLRDMLIELKEKEKEL